MCRIFGFRSVLQSQVHQSLIEAENALHLQSERHPDGWGVAYYIADTPHVIRSTATALSDSLFKRVSGIVTSQTVVAHLRKATKGNITSVNTHPFQHGRWVFAHNGNLTHFEKYRRRILKEVSPELVRFILGDTDSEVIFYFLLTQLMKRRNIHDPSIPLSALMDAMDEGILKLQEIVGPMHSDDAGNPNENYLTFVITNGKLLIGFQGGKALHYSTYKKRCGERQSCPFFAPQCETPSTDGYVNHLIFSSEPLSGENIWQKMNFGELVGIDGSMKMEARKLILVSPEEALSS